MSQGQKFPKSRVNITSFYPKPRPISYRHPHMSNQYIPIRIYISLWLLFTYLYLLLLSVVSLNRANFIFHVISSHTATRTHAHNACSRPASRYQTTAVACKSRNKYVLAKPQVFTRISHDVWSVVCPVWSSLYVDSCSVLIRIICRSSCDLTFKSGVRVSYSTPDVSHDRLQPHQQSNPQKYQ